jgi:hypothetical protein
LQASAVTCTHMCTVDAACMIQALDVNYVLKVMGDNARLCSHATPARCCGSDTRICGTCLANRLLREHCLSISSSACRAQEVSSRAGGHRNRVVQRLTERYRSVNRMADFKQIRASVWHPTAARFRTTQREAEDSAACQCEPRSKGGISCSTEKCVNRGCRIECPPLDCPCGDECENQQIQRAKGQRVPQIKCAPTLP